jgi:hypothetical protein
MEINSRTDKIKRLIKTLECRFCPPNQGHNRKRKPKHGVKKPKYKDKIINLN